MNWLHANSYWLVPLVVYAAMNLAKRSFLVENPNPIVRGFASVLESILVLEWNKWGGSLKGKDGP